MADSTDRRETSIDLKGDPEEYTKRFFAGPTVTVSQAQFDEMRDKIARLAAEREAYRHAIGIFLDACGGDDAMEELRAVNGLRKVLTVHSDKPSTD